jgi:glycosyltransferase involved in cell wall biosynthesis
MNDVLLNWHLGSTFGWGILGLNLFFQWANDPLIRPLMGQPITRDGLGLVDPLRLGRAYPAIEQSNRHLAAIRVGVDNRRRTGAIVVDALGNELTGSNWQGRRNVARCIFENTDIARGAAALTRYDELLVASRWNADLLERVTGRKAKIIFEGVDTSLFCPGPKSGLMASDKFYVFSGGKVEFRKGQDLVLLAFARFAQRHRDAVLVTAWHSIWPHLSAGFKGRLTAPLTLDDRGQLDVRQWVARNGIDPKSMIDIGLVPNAMMPSILREMDVTLQPSRAEACTSLPVKEAMACGVPVIAALNTGMKDLLDDDNAILLRSQASIDNGEAAAMQGWGESDIDEIVAALEFAYEQREHAREIGLASRAWLIGHDRTWQAHARELKGWLLSL